MNKAKLSKVTDYHLNGMISSFCSNFYMISIYILVATFSMPIVFHAKPGHKSDLIMLNKANHIQTYILRILTSDCYTSEDRSMDEKSISGVGVCLILLV